jgi:hypothetical protein
LRAVAILIAQGIALCISLAGIALVGMLVAVPGVILSAFIKDHPLVSCMIGAQIAQACWTYTLWKKSATK